MRTRITVFRFTFWLGWLFLLYGCSEDPSSPVGPPPEAEITIGPEGGNLSTPTFLLTVPPGAFATATRLKLYREAPEVSFGADSTNSVYRVEGLPWDYTEPVTVRILFPTDPPDTPLMAVGEEVFTPSKAAAQRGWRVLGAENETGWCVYDLPTPARDSTGSKRAMTGKAATGSPYFFAPVYGQVTYETPARHFRIRFLESSMTVPQAAALGEYLEDAHQICQDLGFSYAARSRWPVDVEVKFFPDADADRHGLAFASHLGDDHGWLEFNIRLIADSDLVRLTAGHEFFHLVQALYDPRPAGEQAEIPGRHLWLDEAMSVWSEELFTDEEDYVPAVRAGFEMLPYAGMHAGATGDALDARNHGYGMSALVNYVALRWGTARLPLIYQQIALGKHPVEAVEAGVAPLTDWWSDFLREYIEAPLYGLQAATVLDHRSGDYEVFSIADTLAAFSHDYADLSGRLFLVDLSQPDLDDEAELQLLTDDFHCVIVAFSYEAGNGFAPLLHNPFTLTIPNLRALNDAGQDILVLVIYNRREPPSYAERTRVRLTARIQGHVELPTIHSCNLNFRCHAHWRNSAGANWDTPQYDLRVIDASGSFIGTVFYAQWDSISVFGVRHTGSFSVELDPNNLALTHWELFSRRDYPGPDTFQVLSCSGGDLDLGYQDNDRLAYGVSGPGSCRPGPVQSFYAVLVNGGDIAQELSDFECDPTSYIDIFLGEWPK